MIFASAGLWLGGAVSGGPLYLHSPPLSDSQPAACVTVSTEARWAGLAYNHIVRIANGCRVAQSCTVMTDVNPEPQMVTVSSGSTVEVVTFIGSPARTFTASVRCTS